MNEPFLIDYLKNKKNKDLEERESFINVFIFKNIKYRY